MHISNYRPVKRVLDVVEIFERVRREMPVRLLLVGDGPDRGKVERRCYDCDTCDQITFLGNLEPLLERWQAPISVAVYSPGSDLEDTIDAILYYRDCGNSDLVRTFATFHVFFDMTHIPATIPRHETLLKRRLHCQPPEGLGDNITTYRHRNNLDYPINVARNVARVTANTHFIFPSDIELYPR